MFREFLSSAATFARNPLGIIALFIALIYGLATLLLTFSGPSLSEAQKWPIVWFLVFFPLVVLLVFYLLVAKHHAKLYAPRDFKDEESFLRTLPAEVQRARIETELAASPPLPRVDSLPEEADDPEPEEEGGVSSEGRRGRFLVPPKWKKEDYLIAEELALRYIENEVKEPVQRQVSVGDRLDLAFDAATIRNDVLYLIEVKPTLDSGISSDVVDALISRVQEADRFLKRELQNNRVEARLMLVLVTQLPEDERMTLENKLRSYVDIRSDSVEVRVLPLDLLHKHYGATDEPPADTASAAEQDPS